MNTSFHKAPRKGRDTFLFIRGRGATAFEHQKKRWGREKESQQAQAIVQKNVLMTDAGYAAAIIKKKMGSEGWGPQRQLFVLGGRYREERGPKGGGVSTLWVEESRPWESPHPPEKR